MDDEPVRERGDRRPRRPRQSGGTDLDGVRADSCRTVLPRAVAAASSWNSRTLPSAFGVCWSKQIEQRGTPTPCTSAHLIQQLAFGFAAGPLDTSQALVSRDDPALVLAGCRRLAATILAVKDPTAGGALEVEAVADPAGAPYVQCAVSATHGRKLIGSVIGLGTKPVPLA